MNYTLNLSPQDARGVRIVHTAGMRSLAFSLFLGLLGLGLWKAGPSPVRLLALTLIGAVTALLLPPSFTPLASALFLAGVTALSWTMIRWPLRARPTVDLSHGSHKQPSGAAAANCHGAGLFGNRESRADRRLATCK